MKTKFLLIGVIVVSAIFISSHKENKNIDLLLENIDAYAGSDEHGDIDETLVPYSKLGEKTIYCILDGKCYQLRFRAVSLIQVNLVVVLRG